jgi:hypothetical protein
MSLLDLIEQLWGFYVRSKNFALLSEQMLCYRLICGLRKVRVVLGVGPVEHNIASYNADSIIIYDIQEIQLYAETTNATLLFKKLKTV